jgi:hypothetical protein
VITAVHLCLREKSMKNAREVIEEFWTSLPDYHCREKQEVLAKSELVFRQYSIEHKGHNIS